MNFSQHPDDAEDYCHGTVQQEAHKEMVQQFGMARPDAEWVLTDFDVWEKNPYFTGVPSGRHPEDDHDEEPVKNVLHFGQVTQVSAAGAREYQAESDNYDFTYHYLPYSGVVADSLALSKILRIIHKRLLTNKISIGYITVKKAATPTSRGTILFRLDYYKG